MNCGSKTAESCESCTSCSGPEDIEADCLFEPGGPPGSGNPDQCVLKSKFTFLKVDLVNFDVFHWSFCL